MIARLLAVLLFLLAAAAGLQAAEPVARVKVLTPPPIVPGQQVEIQVDVLAPNFFLSPPKFPLFDLTNAVVTLPDAGAMNLVETIDGQSFAGIRRTYLVTPQAPGDFTLPPARITFTYAAVPGQPGREGSVTLPAQTFTVAGAPQGAGTAAAARITVTQDLDRDPKGLKEGDTLVRTVTIKAEGLQAMMIPAPEFTVPPGVRLYPHDPVLTDNQDPRNGPVGGRRVDKVTYEFEKAGRYDLPAIDIGWYDSRTQKHNVAEAPEVSATVAEGAGFASAIAPPDAQKEAPPPHPVPWKSIGWAAVVFAGLAFLLWLVPRLWTGWSAWRRARRQRYEQSEAYSFRELARACRSREDASVYRAVQAWADRIQAAPLRDWLRGKGADAALCEYERLEARLFSGVSGSFDAAKLLSGITAARRTWRAHESEASVPALPPLNP